MKRILLSLVAIATISLTSFGQAPEGFKYQAVIRDAGNLILNNQTVGMRLTIQQGSIGGVTAYSETFSVTSNAYGLVNLEIGTGTTSYDFTNIDWSVGPYFMETAVDITGGTSYTVMGTSQLMSVPYALYAKTSGNGAGPVGPQGLAGNDGVDGIDGAQGIQGNDGAVGATGPQGPAGNDGAAGATGANGTTGLTGPVGPQGPIGLTGAQGIQGLSGTNGAPGATGPQGPAGVNGLDGASGATGSQGQIGLTGPAGPQGATGLTGAQGPAGNDGAIGAQGIQGLTGATGIQGPAGNDGQGGVTAAGSNVTITGTGTSGDPYVVNASDNVDDADNDSSNEIQLLSVNNDSLMISGGNSVSINSIVNGNPCPNSITVPDGICQAQIISNSNVNGSTYTVPANKNLYLNRLLYRRKGVNTPRYAQIYVNGALVLNDNVQAVQCGVTLLDDNVILPPGTTVTATVTSGGGWNCYTTAAENNMAVIDGFLVDKKVDALFLTSNYTVPAGKYFIQTNSTYSTPLMYASGSTIIAAPTLYISGYLMDN